MIDIRIVNIVDDINDSITSHKTKFKLEECKCGTKLLYADIELCWFNLFSEGTVHIVIPREDIRVDLGLLFGERIIVTKCVAHIIIDKILHTNSVYRLMWEQVTKEKENENDKK